jgi:hypothetical protein
MQITGTGPITQVRAALTRAARTAAQTALATLGTGAVNIIEADWEAVGALSAGAAVVSILTSIAFPPPEVGTVLGTVEHTEG